MALETRLSRSFTWARQSQGIDWQKFSWRDKKKRAWLFFLFFFFLPAVNWWFDTQRGLLSGYDLDCPGGSLAGGCFHTKLFNMNKWNVALVIFLYSCKPMWKNYTRSMFLFHLRKSRIQTSWWMLYRFSVPVFTEDTYVVTCSYAVRAQLFVLQPNENI